jgi:hypothetical protein
MTPETQSPRDEAKSRTTELSKIGSAKRHSHPIGISGCGRSLPGNRNG